MSQGPNVFDYYPQSLQILTASPLPFGYQGSAYSVTFTAAGGVAPYAWTVAPGTPLPHWLTLSRGGTLSGTPPAGSLAPVGFSIGVTDSSGRTATAPVVLPLGPRTPLQITTSALPVGQQNQPYSATLAASGGTSPYTWSIAPSTPLPQGLSLDTATGKISGTPAAARSSQIVVSVSDATKPPVFSAYASLLLEVVPPTSSAPLGVLSAGLPSAGDGQAYSQALDAYGGQPPYIWKVASGSLPPGLALSSGGVISGAPHASAHGLGAYNFRVQVSDSAQKVASATLIIYVLPAGLGVTAQDSGTSASPGGSASAGGAGTASPETAATAVGGQGTVFAASYSNSPGGPSPFQAGGNYFDVDLSSGSSFTSVTITECGVALGDQMQWLDPAKNSSAGGWVPVTPPATFDPDSGCLNFTATSATAPSVSEITDTVFGAGPLSAPRPLPTVHLSSPAQPFQLSPTITVSYGGAATQGSLTGYNVRYEVAPWNGRFGHYVALARHSPATRQTLRGVPGNDYCFSVQAIDSLGGTSGWSPGKCTALPLDDTALTAATKGWTRGHARGFYEGTFTKTSRGGAELKLANAQLDRVAILVEQCRTCGNMTVYLNGRALKTISTHNQTTKLEALVLLRPFAERRATILIKNVSPRKTLVVDGIGVSRS